MPTLQEIKDVVEYDVSDTIEKKRFLMFVNSCLADLTEIYKLEKELEFTITGSDQEYQLPTELFQVLTVEITNEREGYENELVKEISTMDYLRKNNSIRLRNVYSRYNNKLKIRSCIYDGKTTASESTVKVRYYATLPRFDYSQATLSLTTTYPPIREQHYHEAIIFYVAYRYFVNAQQDTEANRMERLYNKSKMEIENYVHKHRHSSNISRKVEIVR